MNQPDDTDGRARFDWEIMRMLLPYVWAYRGRTAVAVVLLIAAKAATVTVPLVLKQIVDALDKSAHATLVLPLGLLVGYGALRLASSGFQELRNAVFAKMRFGIMRQISMQVVEHLHELSLGFHLDRKTGAITRDINRGTRSISNLLNYLLFRIVPTLIEIGLVAAILVSKYSGWFAAILVGAFVVYVVFTLRVTEWRIEYREARNEAESRANNRAIDGLINYETVKYFGNEDYELQRYGQNLADWKQSAVRSRTSLSLLNGGQRLIIALGVTGMMILASDGVVNGDMSVGDLVAVNAYLLQVFMPLGFLGTVYSILKHALRDMDRMFGLLDRDPRIQDAADAKTLEAAGGKVVFEAVNFGYEPDRQVLHDIDLEIPAGQKLAVVGPSGAGKSTLARLVFRFFDVDSGRILVDGHNIAGVTQKSLRAAIGIVPQDTVLFNESVFFNIQYGDLDATDDQVIRAAQMASIHEFIGSLPNGYDTVVGERGLKLSGGEKQRVAIARAILKNPAILVFDEATSSLDTGNEQAILEALREVSANHTTLAIAHRLSTIVDADQIIVMQRGRIVERGNHAELIAAGGVYAQMWDMQQSEDVSQPAMSDNCDDLSNI